MYVLKNNEGKIISAARRIPTNREGQPLPDWELCDDEEALQNFLSQDEQN